MKNKLFPIFLSLLALGTHSCMNLNTVTGDGNVISEIRNVGEFNAIEASVGLNVFVKFGEVSDDVEVVADQNLHDYIETEVIGGTLKITSRRSIRRAAAKDIFVSAGSLDEINVSSAADLTGEGVLVAGRLRLNASSAADLDIEVQADDIELNISSSAEAELRGNARSLNADISSAGDLDAENLEVVNCTIDVSSAGDASVNVSGELRASASSAGHISYTGNPEIKEINSSSAGSISKK